MLHFMYSWTRCTVSEAVYLCFCRKCLFILHYTMLSLMYQWEPWLLGLLSVKLLSWSCFSLYYILECNIHKGVIIFFLIQLSIDPVLTRPRAVYCQSEDLPLWPTFITHTVPAGSIFSIYLTTHFILGLNGESFQTLDCFWKISKHLFVHREMFINYAVLNNFGKVSSAWYIKYFF